MKQLCACVTAMTFALAAGAQLVNVESIQRVKTTVSVDKAVISPDGNSVIASTNDDLSLMEVDLASGRSLKVADNATTYQLRFTADSKCFAYVGESTGTDMLRYKEVKAFDRKTRATRRLMRPTRTFNAIAMRNNRTIAVNDAKVYTLDLTDTRAANLPVAYTYYGQLMLDVDGTSIALNPQGKEGQSYLWPSVSPDGKHVTYYLATVGAFVCDIDGSNPRYLGELRAPAWLGDNMVVGMHDIDDGSFVTSSTLIVSDFDGNKQEITPSDIIAMNPTVSADGSKVAFSTDNGQLYIINLKH